MSFFQATGILGTLNTMVGILLSIRRCYKAKKKISSLVRDSLSSLEKIKQAAPKVSRFVEVGGIDLGDFCDIACKIMALEVDLLNMGAKLHKNNKFHRFCSAPETTTALQSIRTNLSQMESDLRFLLVTLRSDVKVSVLLEAFEPVLNAVEDITPHMEAFKEKQHLLADARSAFGTRVLASRMNRLVTQSMESVYYLIMGKMFFQGISVEVDYGKSASFFQCAINYGNSQAFAYLGWQHCWGLGMRKDGRRAMELYMNGAELRDPDCLYEVGRCFEYGYGVEQDKYISFDYYAKAAKVGHVGGKREVGTCLHVGKGTEVNLVRAAKYYKAAAEAGDEGALCYYGNCMLYGSGVEKNAQVGVVLLKIAVSAGSIEALVNLGECYMIGLGVEQDAEKAFRFFLAAAKERYSDGLAKVGECLVYGTGVSQNKSKGVRYLRKAAQDGSPHALKTLTGLYRKGIGVAENKRKALVTYKRAAHCGNMVSNLYLGEMYRDGEGTIVNVKKAIHHFEIYAKFDQDEGHLNLALVYENQDGFFNKDRAQYHFRLAADLGNQNARRRLGDYLVRASRPSKLSLTNDELDAFLRKMKAEYSRRKKRNVLALQGLPLDCTLPDLSIAPTIVEDPTSPTKCGRDDQSQPAVTLANLLALLSHRHPYWWVIPFGLVNLFMGIFVSYLFFYR